MQPSPALSHRLAREVGATIFGGNITGYDAARLGYPGELYDAVQARCGPEVGSLLEVGPGTGLATFDLLATFKPHSYVGVESDPLLAAHLSAAIAGSENAGIVTGKFEDFVSQNCFDLACCAASFHWLEPELAYANLKQFLRPKGTVAIWWNCYRQTAIGDPFADRAAPLLARLPLAPSEGRNGHYSLDVDLHREAMTTAGFCDFEPHLFRRERILTTEQVVTLYASYSYIRALPPAERYDILASIAELAAGDFGGKVPNVVLTALYMASAPGAE